MKRICDIGRHAMALLLALAMLLPMLGTAQPVMAVEGQVAEDAGVAVPGTRGVVVGVARESDMGGDASVGGDARTILPEVTRNSSVSVNAVWNGDDPSNRPESMTIQLRMDGIAYGDPVHLTAGDMGEAYGGTGGNFTVNWPNTTKRERTKKIEINAKNYSEDLGGTGTSSWYSENKFPTDATYISNLRVGPLMESYHSGLISDNTYSFALGEWRADNRIYNILRWNTLKSGSTYKLFDRVSNGRSVLSENHNLDANDDIVEKIIYPTNGDICFAVYNVTTKEASYFMVEWDECTQKTSSMTCAKAYVSYKFAVDDRGWMEISKPEDANDPDKSVTYTYTITDEVGNAAGELNLKAGETGKVEKLPEGTYYVTESLPYSGWSYEWQDLPDYHSWTVDVLGKVDGYVTRVTLDPVVSNDGRRDVDCRLINIPVTDVSGQVNVIVNVHDVDGKSLGADTVLRCDGEEFDGRHVSSSGENPYKWYDSRHTWTVNLDGLAPEGYTQTIASHIEQDSYGRIVYDVTFTRIATQPPDWYDKTCVILNSEWIGDYHYVFLGDQHSEFDGNGTYWSSTIHKYGNYSDTSHVNGMCVRLLRDGRPVTDSFCNCTMIFASAWLGPGIRYTGADGTFLWVETADLGVWDDNGGYDWSIETTSMPCYNTEVGDPLVEIRDGIKYITYDITNTYTGEVPESTDVIVVYDRLDIDPDATLDGAEIKAQLCRDGADFGEPVVLNEENEWQHKWTGLEGNHEWTVKRIGSPAEGYESNETTAAYGVETDAGMHGYVVCSIADVTTAREQYTDPSGARKVWFDDGGPSRPDTLEVGGYMPGKYYDDSVKDTNWPSSLASATGWKYMWNGMSNYYWNPYEVVPEKYEERFFYNGQLAVFVNISTLTETNDFLLPRTGGDGTRNLMLVASVLVLASGLALLADRRRKQHGR